MLHTRRHKWKEYDWRLTGAETKGEWSKNVFKFAGSYSVKTSMNQNFYYISSAELLVDVGSKRKFKRLAFGRNRDIISWTHLSKQLIVFNESFSLFRCD